MDEFGIYRKIGTLTANPKLEIVQIALTAKKPLKRLFC
jgi:hypothetical protein